MRKEKNIIRKIEDQIIIIDFQNKED